MRAMSPKQNGDTRMSENKVNASAVKRGPGRPRKYDYPSELTCSVTGGKVKTNPVQIQKLLAKTGKTLAELVSTYVSRAGKQKLKGQVVVAAQAPAPAPSAEAPAVEAPAETVATETKSETESTNGDSPAVDGSRSGRGALVASKGASPLPEFSPCWYPNRYLDNFKCCITCDHLPICGCPLSFEWKGKTTNDKIKKKFK